jgi:hypothetical protein
MNTIITPHQAPPVPENPYGINFLMITIYDHGGVSMGIEGIPSSPNVNFFGIDPSDALYGDLYYIFISIDPSTSYIVIGLAFYGDKLSNESYLNYATSIKEFITNNLISYGFTLSDLSSESATDTVYTYFFWEYTYTVSNFLNGVLSQLTYDSSESNFSEFINLNSTWSINIYHNFIIKNQDDDTFEHLFYVEVLADNVFKGNGTHQFSLKSIIGKNSLPTVAEGYYIMINNPAGSQIDTTSFELNGANLVGVENNFIVIHVPPNTSVSDIKYNFTFDFPEQQDTTDVDSTTPGDETTGEEGGETTDLSTVIKYAPYIGVGFIALVGVLLIITRRR